MTWSPLAKVLPLAPQGSALIGAGIYALAGSAGLDSQHTLHAVAKAAYIERMANAFRIPQLSPSIWNIWN